MAKVTPQDRKEVAEVRVKTKKNSTDATRGHMWWKARGKAELAQQVLDTASFLKDQQQARWRQASIFARLYGNMPLTGFAGSTLSNMSPAQQLPIDRPTMNVVQSCADTLVSRIAQSKPRPVFLTDNGDYKQRNLAKQLNQFISGEFFQCKAYQLMERILLDASILGTGCLKVYESADKRVALERVLPTELFVDANDAFYGSPRSLYQAKLVDRAVLASFLPEEKSKIQQAEQAYPDQSAESQKTMSDQIQVIEAWHLPSSPGASDGRHVIVATSGVILDEEYTEDTFPFVFMHYAPRLVGFWAQGLAEQLMGTQVEINKLMITISQSISLVGVPRVFVEDGSKVVKSHLNNDIGAIVTYRGTKPEYTVAPSVHPELYQQLQRLIDYAYQQSGISSLSAASKKPMGLNSGAAIREYDDLQSDRFATLNKRYDQLAIDLAYLMINKAKKIAERDGKYQTIYPSKDGTKEIDLPMADLLDNPFVIQCYDSSSLPRDPAGRKQAVIEDMQAGLISPEEGRRLVDYPDLEQVNKLEFSTEERILKILDQIVNEGKFNPPDAYIAANLELAKKLVVQYYNLHEPAGLEESRCQMLRDWQAQLMELVPQQPMAPPMPGAPMAQAEAAPTNPMIPFGQ